LASKGPSLFLPFAPSIEKGVGSLADKAKSASNEFTRLRREMQHTLDTGNKISAAQGEMFRRAKTEHEKFQGLLKRDRDALKDMRDGKWADRARGRFFGSLASGDILGLSESLLTSNFGAKILKKVGLPSAGEMLSRLMPKAFMVGEVIQGGVNAYQAAKGSERSDFAALQAWKKGEISNQTLLKVLDIDDGARWRVAAQALPLGLNNIFDSPEEAKEAIIAKAKTSTDKELFPWMKKAMEEEQKKIDDKKARAEKEPAWDRRILLNEVMLRERKQKAVKEYQEEIEKELTQIDKEYKGDSAKVMTTEKVERLKEKYKKKSQTLEEDILELETEAKKLFILDDVSKGRARAQKETKNNSKAFWEEEERRVIEETFREYRRGYVPFNRNE
jgi:hypothetical protein